MAVPERSRRVERSVIERLRRLERQIGDDLQRIRIDAGASKAAVAAAAGIDRTYYAHIENGEAHPSLETIIALSTALGADLSLRLYDGTGPDLTDRHSARMAESILGELDPVWRPHLEVPVWRPTRGVIDLVLERIDGPMLVLSELQAMLRRLEQLIRWLALKADSIGSSELVGDLPVPPTSRLLIVRSTDANRTVARSFERVLRAAYPSRTVDAVASLRDGAPWPGDSIVWVRLDGHAAHLLDGPPRGVLLGR